MELLVCVGGLGDVQPFRMAMDAAQITVFDAEVHDQEWVEEHNTGMVDATYFVVQADDAELVREAVRRACRDARWPEGPPHYGVVAQREDGRFQAFPGESR